MRGDDHSGPDLRALLERVESRAPTDAVEAVAAELAVMVGARAVSFQPPQRPPPRPEPS